MRVRLSVLALAGLMASGLGTAWAQSLYHSGFQSAPGLQAPSRQVGSFQVDPSGWSVPMRTITASKVRASSAASSGVSRRKAIGASLLLPGWGQWLRGHRTRAKAFFITEMAVMASYVFFEGQEHVRQNRYVDYAEHYANVADASGKDKNYYRNLRNYSSSDDYVEYLQSTARALYGDDLAQRNEYIARFTPSAAEAWAWESDAHRQEYGEQHKAALNSNRLAKHMLGVALLNRVLSAIDAAFRATSSSPQTVYIESGDDGTNYVGLRLQLD